MGCIFLVALVSGCGTQQRVVAPSVNRAVVKKIAIIPIKNPRHFEVDKRGGPLSLLPGGKIWRELETSGKSSAFTRRMRELGFTNIGEELTARVSEHLEKRGYQTTVLSGARIRIDPDDPGDIEYEKIATDADAILNVWIQEVGAFSVLSSLVYRPQLNLGVTLIGVGPDGEEFYDETIVYGAHAGSPDQDEIPSDKKFEYKDYDALMARAPEAVESLQIGVAALAELIAINLEPYKKITIAPR